MNKITISYVSLLTITLVILSTQPSIVGLWQSTEENATVEFKANGEIIIVDNMSAMALGRYKIKDDGLIKIELFADNILRDSVQPSPKTEITAKIIKLNGDFLELYFYEGELGETEYYRRIR